MMITRHWQALCAARGWRLDAPCYVETDDELTPAYPIAVYDVPGHRVISVTEDLAAFREDIAALPTEWTIEQLTGHIFPGISAKFDADGFYLLPEAAALPDTPFCRPLTPADDAQWQLLLETCTVSERLTGEISLEDPLAYGAFTPDGRLVSAASFLYWGEELADVGVLTHGGYRRQGYGLRAVAALCKAGREMGKLIQYRCDDTNIGSRSICGRLGFVPTVRLAGVKLLLPEE